MGFLNFLIKIREAKTDENKRQFQSSVPNHGILIVDVLA
jgi:hypothetical protein